MRRRPDLYRRDMEFRIAFDELEPPAGSTTADDRTVVPFAGWLGLLRAIETYVEERKRDAPPGHGRAGSERWQHHDGEGGQT